MSEETQQRIVKFFVTEFGRPGERTCQRVTLFRGPSGSKGIEITAWTREEDPERFVSLARIEDLAREVLDIADKDAQNVGSADRQRYEVRTLQHLGSSARCAFLVDVETGQEEARLRPLEQPSVDGQIAQQMRHAEWTTQKMLEVVSNFQSSTFQQIRHLSEENRKLYEDRSAMIAKIEDTQQEKHERETAMMLEMGADERKDYMLKQLMPMLPILVSRFAGKGDPAPPGSGALAAIIKQLTSSLGPEQVAAIQGALSMQQQRLFMEAASIAHSAMADTSAPPSPSKPSGSPGSSGQPANQ